MFIDAHRRGCCLAISRRCSFGPCLMDRMCENLEIEFLWNIAEAWPKIVSCIVYVLYKSGRTIVVLYVEGITGYGAETYCLDGFYFFPLRFG